MTKVEFIVITPVFEELKKLSERRGKLGDEAALVLKNVEDRCVIRDWCLQKSVDQSIIDACRSLSSSVATADIELRRKLREKWVPVISLRGDRLHCEPESIEYWGQL